MHIILASGSPRRRDFLHSLGLTFDVAPADIDESTRIGEAPSDYVARLALEKAEAVAAQQQAGQHVLVIAADTTVTIDNMILGKPADDAEGRAMLQRLSGRTHEVLTGVAVSLRRGNDPTQSANRVVSTRVVCPHITEPDIDWYLSTGEGRDKAGGYAIQGQAAVFVQAVHGSVTNVVGLPLVELGELLGVVGLSFHELRIAAG